MTTLKPYTVYRDPDVEWLGEIPAHWAIASLRQLCGIAGGMTPSKSRLDYWKGDVPWVSPKDMKRFRIRTAIDSISREAVGDTGLTLLPAGSVLTVVRGMILARKVPIAVTEAPVTINQDMKALRPGPRIDALYLARTLSAGQDALFPLIDEAGHGTRRLPTPSLMSVSVPVPPLDEQRAIAAFLDAMDARITRFIAARRKMIRLLEEKKQAVINQAVTKGLDPTVPLKDSGVDWLEKIPTHWQTPKIGHFARVGNGSTPSRGESRYWTSEGFPWLNSGSVHQGVVESTDQFVTEAALRECHLPIVRPGDLLVAITGQGKTRGTAAIVNMNATINQHMAYINIRKPWTSTRFLHLALTGAYLYLREISSDSGSTKGALTCADIQHFKVPVPPMSEQEAIADFVDRELCRIDQVTTRSLREIELMQEYRTRLISDVVTGKLDVRGVDLGELPELEEIPDGDGLTAMTDGNGDQAPAKEGYS